MSLPSAPQAEPLAPYRAIVEHAEMELELAGHGDVEGLSALADRWERLVASLPADPPAGASMLLEQAQLLHERTRVELIRVRESLLHDFATARRARRAADGYGPSPGVLRRLNRSA